MTSSTDDDRGQSVAVVISTYNRPKALNLVLGALAIQSRPPDEIFVADDGSDENTRDVITAWQRSGLPLHHVWHEDKGYRKTIVMNRALSRVTSAYVIFLDGDCIPGERFVADHLLLAEEGCILAGGRVLASKGFTDQLERRSDPPQLSRLIYWAYQRLCGRINRMAPFFRLPNGGWRKLNPQKWELVRGCNFSLATAKVRLVDGFEESLYGWGPDDSDLAVRLINAGLKIKTARFSALVLHLWHKEEDRGNLDRNREYLFDAINSKRTRAIVGLSSNPSRSNDVEPAI